MNTLYTHSPGGDGGESEIIGGDETSLREFLTHMVDGYGGVATVHIQAIPEDIGFDLPDGLTVIGSIVRAATHFPGGGGMFELLLQSADAPELVMGMFRRHWLDAGWNEVSMNQSRGGFVDQIQQMANFCNPTKDVGVAVNANHSGSGTRIRLYAYSGKNNHICMEHGGNYMQNALDITPNLITPDDVTTLPGMHGGAMPVLHNGVLSMIRLMTAYPVAQLAPIYKQQIETAGWRLLQQVESDISHSSSWEKSDADDIGWYAVFTVTRDAAKTNEYIAMLTVQQS